KTAVSVLQQLNSAPAVSQLLKSIPAEIGRPADVDWAERFDEAAGLLMGNKIVLAQSKFESLNRTTPNQPAILSGLLTCAIWRGDTDGQSQLLRKLSQCEDLDFQSRVRYRAMSALVVPQTPELSVGVYRLTAEVEKADEIEMAMMSDARFVALPPEMLSRMRASEDHVPPKAAFQILDRDKPESLESLPPVGEVPQAKAIVFLFGKQTDREARVEVQDVRGEDLEEVRSRVAGAIGDQKLEQQEGDSLPLILACQPPVAMIRFQAKPAEAEVLQAELVQARMPAAIAGMNLPLLGGKSLLDLADDESMLLERSATLCVVEQYDAIVSKGDHIADEVYRLAGLDPPPKIRPQNDEIESLANEELNRVDPSDLNADSLFYLAQRSQQISATSALRRFAGKLTEIDVTEEQRPMKLFGYMALVESAERSEQALQTLEDAKAYADANNIPSANLLLSEVGLRLAAGDGPGFQNAIQTLTTRYGNQPEVMAQLQQMLMAYGLIGPDGAPRSQPPDGVADGGPGAPSPASPAASGGGIWTPDSGAPPTEPASEGGGGKLWIPGMD
ncbi:MAG: protein-disulfide isomerase, partial [Pirellulales bacterium]|nr:protein-disulfide isomerase [Pirellulales bacterium]